MISRQFSSLACAAVLLGAFAMAVPVAAQTTPGTGGSTPTQPGSTAPVQAPAPTQQAPAAPTAADQATDSGRSTGDASTAASVELKARPAIVISGTADWEEGFAKLGTAFTEARAALAKAGLQPGGKPLAVFRETDDQGFKFDAMIPLAAAPAAALSLPADAKVGQTPSGKAMKFEHRSAYDDIDSTYEAITAYLDEKAIEAQPMFIEEYLTEPKTSDDTSLQVDIYVFTR